jgi:ABC-type multidrug transport system ATPase subunit
MTITTESLGKRFNRSWIFKNLNQTFNPGVYAITGPNGSGKSTLLKVLWGQLPASAGTIRYMHNAEIPVEDVHPHLAIAAPYMDLIEELTLEEALKFHYAFKKIRLAESITEVMEKLELSHARKKTINQFSSGMKQRVKLGLAFFSEAKMIFLDEPTTNLDSSAIEWYWKNMTQLSPDCLIFIGSNLENDYPRTASKIDLLQYK